MSIKLPNGWMEAKYKYGDLMGTANDTGLSFGKVSLITMDIM